MSIPSENIICPHCNSTIGATPAHCTSFYNTSSTLTGFFDSELDSNISWVAICPACKDYILLIFDESESLLATYPRQSSKKVSKDFPDFLKADLQEAYNCISVDAYNATGLICGRIVQQICKDKTANGGDLEKKIDDLASKGILTPDLKEWAHSVRFLRNDGGHIERNPVNKESANEAIEFCEQLIIVLYILPQKAKKHIASHQKI